jgi:hypothetical protein
MITDIKVVLVTNAKITLLGQKKKSRTCDVAVRLKTGFYAVIWP